MSDKISYPHFLNTVMTSLYLRYDHELDCDIRELKPGLHVVATPDLRCLLVDSNRKIVEVDDERLLPADFPGRIYPEHVFQVFWTDEGGDQLFTVRVSGPRLARQFAQAPEQAWCVEVDPVTLGWPSWAKDE